MYQKRNQWLKKIDGKKRLANPFLHILSPMSEEIDNLCPEQIGDDITKEVNAWIRPELAKIIGWPCCEKIKDKDFESVMRHSAMRYL